jgi:succinate-acetate transporter protein
MSCLGNPAPLGLLAFGMTTAMLMFVDMEWVETSFDELVAGYAIFLGGVAQVLVAIFELIKGSSFSFAVFGCYGTFWLGWAIVVIENSRTDSEFGETPYPSGRAAWLTQWCILTACFFVITLRKNIALIIVFALLTTTFALLAAGAGSGNTNVRKVGGYFGFLTALGAFYTGIAELVNEEYGRHILPGLTPIRAPERYPITKESIMKCCAYDSKTNTMFLQFRGIQIKSADNIQSIKEGVESSILATGTKDNKVHVVVDYENVLIADDIFEDYWKMVAELERTYYLSAKRFHVTSFGTGFNGGGVAMRKATEPRPVLENKASYVA